MLYFAYGCNMHAGQMQRLCPGCSCVAAARLADHRLAFTRPFAAWDGAGVADIVASTGDLVEGVVWEITDAHRTALDVYEEYPTAYTRKDVSVETFGGERLRAFAYVAKPLGAFRPGRRYMQSLIEGARAHGLSAQYIAWLEAIPTEG